jgi:hypothetical protein
LGSNPDGNLALRAETFDDLVLCVLADDAFKILGSSATSRERFAPSGAKFFDDITITHSDSAYFLKHYATKFDQSLCAQPKTHAQEDQIAFSRGEQRGVGDEPSGYRPMYYTKTYEQDPENTEMSLTARIISTNSEGITRQKSRQCPLIDMFSRPSS